MSGSARSGPVKAEEITEHHMHSEFCMMSAETAELLNRDAPQTAARIVCCRHDLVPDGRVSGQNRTARFRESSAWTDIFIYPGYKFRALDALITNFHLPESTLVMLVVRACRAGRISCTPIRWQCRNDIAFSRFGDAMFIH